MARLTWPEGTWLQDKLADDFRICGLRHTTRKRSGQREVYKVLYHYELQPKRWARDFDDHVVWLPPELVREFALWMGSSLARRDGVHMNRGDSWQLYFDLELAQPSAGGRRP